MTIERTEYNKRIVEVEMTNKKLGFHDTFTVTGYCKDYSHEDKEGDMIRFASFIAYLTENQPNFKSNQN